MFSDLELLFIDGFEFEYNYPSYQFFPTLPMTSDSGKARLADIFMLWTRDHLAQSKIGGVKDVCYNVYRRDVMVEGLFEKYVVYPDNKRQTSHTPPL